MSNPYTKKRMPRADRRLLGPRPAGAASFSCSAPGRRSRAAGAFREASASGRRRPRHAARARRSRRPGLTVKVGALLGVYSKPDRDPRGHNVTVLYAARRIRARAQGGDDAAAARVVRRRASSAKVRFAFDHREIVMEQLAKDRDRARRAPAYSAVFSVAEKARASSPSSVTAQTVYR